MIQRYFILAYLGLSTLFLACEKEKENIERPFARLRTLAVSDVDGTGATFNAEVSDIEEDIIDHGFIWSDESRRLILLAPDELNFNLKLSLGANLKGKTFSTRLNSGLRDNQLYFVRAYIITNERTIYGDEVVFNSKGSLPPTVGSISPNPITPGDTMTIRGSNFLGTQESMKILINNSEVTILSISESEIKCIVPLLSASVENKLVIIASSGEESPPFDLPNLSTPELFQLIPSLVSIGDTITLEGRFFSLIKEWNQLLLNGSWFSHELISATNNRLQFIIPSATFLPDDAKLTVRVGDNESEGLTLTFLKPIVEDFYPKEGTLGDTITIVGRNFNSFYLNNSVLFNGNEWKVISGTPMKLEVVVNEQFLGLSLGMSDKIRVITGGILEATSKESFHYTNKDWQIVTELPISSNYHLGYATQQNLYYFYGFETEWLEYQINTQNWQTLNYIPSNIEENFSTRLLLNVGDQGFAVQWSLLLDKFRFFLYQPSTDNWLQMPDLTIANNSGPNACAFSIGREVFLLLGGRDNTNTSWKFNIDTRTWSAIDNYAASVNSVGDIFPLTATSLGQKGYVLSYSANTNSRTLLEYDPINNEWTRVANFDFIDSYITSNTAFAFNDKIYMLSLSFGPSVVYEWDTKTKRTRSYRLHTPPTDVQIGQGQHFVTNGKVFFAIGRYLYEWFPR